jgi:hypothetical protein
MPMTPLQRAQLTDLTAYARSCAAYWGAKAEREMREPRKLDAGLWAYAYAQIAFRWAVDAGGYTRETE